MKNIVLFVIFAFLANSIFAVAKDNDSLTFKLKNEVIVTASRVPVISLVNPFSR